MTQIDVNKHAAALHQQAIVIDGHCDILMPIADNKMRLGQRVEVPDPATWEVPPGVKAAVEASLYHFPPHTYYFSTMSQYDIPRFLEGGLTVQVCAIYLQDHDLERALQRALEMTWWLHREVEENDQFELVTSVDDIHRLKQEGKCGGLLAFEGFEALGFDLRFLDLYYKLGLRMASLTHSRRNAFADGTQSDIKTGGLTKLGRQAVKRMNELGIVIDLAHLNQVGFWEVLELTQAPVILSHSSPRFLFPAGGQSNPRYRGLDLSRSRERLEAIAANGGLIGVIFYNQANLDEVVADIEFVIGQIGPDHIGLGSDLYGVERAPVGLEDMSKLPALTRRLVERGHSDEVIQKVLGGNYLRIFEQVWKS